MSLIVIIHNDGTGDDHTGNYDVTVRINEQVIARRRIEGHHRMTGWEELVRKVPDAVRSYRAGEGK